MSRSGLDARHGRQGGRVVPWEAQPVAPESTRRAWIYPAALADAAHAHADRVGGHVTQPTDDTLMVIAPGMTPPALDDLAATPEARATDPETSQRAATKAAINAASNRARLLIAHHDAGHRGLTGDDIEAATGIAYETIGPRRPSLERAGYVAKAIGDDGQYVTRNDKQVYRITPNGAIEATRIKEKAA